MGYGSRMKPFYVISRQEGDTHRLAAMVASHLRIGDTLILAGDLACGKTSFVKGLAAALGSTDSVTSPTYALVHTYNTVAGDLMHIDAYRLSDLHEFRDLGLEEYLEESIVAIEWGDKVADLFSDYLSIAFYLIDADINHRLVTISYLGERWASEIPNLKKEVGGSDDEPDTSH
jgi:tRNA threonylcarbamoyladenosine biosynthesis protein TsaE